MAMLKFITFASDIELPFYTSLAFHKINHDKLDSPVRRVLGLYEVQNHTDTGAACRMQIHGNALTSDEVPSGSYRAEGMIRNVNTIEEYRALDKRAILERAGRTIWDAICDGTVYSCPSLLASFSVICFADLKKYKFTYLFAFPALPSDVPWRVIVPDQITAEPRNHPDERVENAQRALNGKESTALVDVVQTWRYSVDPRQWGFFLAKKVRSLTPEGDAEDTRPQSPNSPGTPAISLGFKWAVGPISQFENGFFDKVETSDRFICFADPSADPEHPGWPLRNLLILVRRRWKLTKAQILCYRDVQAHRHEARSKILHLELDQSKTLEESLGALAMPKVTGWEHNAARKVTSKIANLGEYMDPQRLADQAVDLNLKLIKWRIAPGLDLDTIKSTKCLLLGAGTLGSYVARNLLGWGVRKITFVDNGSVSFSNPVRQPLFDFKDCLGGGAKKALRAAETLREIYPGVESSGHVLSVPMAGHPIMDEAKTKAEYEQLKALVDEHDAIFLLMDTRESRWLPTVMGKTAGKLVMNAALGFDTFVVMRHGVKNTRNPDDELGCYFCNDVVAPADSMSDRTLDQQCTVTRPGVAAIASALLVEVMVSVLQHKERALAPAPKAQSLEHEDHPLGQVPHQIRGFLSSFSNMVISGKSYDCCSACSDKVTGAYARDGWEFVKQALNEKGFVEELSGLAEIQRQAEKAAADVEWESEGEDGGDIGDGDGELV